MTCTLHSARKKDDVSVKMKTESMRTFRFFMNVTDVKFLKTTTIHQNILVENIYIHKTQQYKQHRKVIWR